MKREYIIETNEGKIYPLGVTKTPGGFDVAFVSEKSPAWNMPLRKKEKKFRTHLEPVLLDGKNGEMRRQQHGRFTHLLKQ